MKGLCNVINDLDTDKLSLNNKENILNFSLFNNLQVSFSVLIFFCKQTLDAVATSFFIYVVKLS